MDKFNLLQLSNIKNILDSLLSTSLFFSFIGLPAISETVQNSFSSGSSNKLKVTLSNTMGVTTSANVTSNLVVDNEATLNIEPGSTIQDSFGNENGEIGGELIVTPTGTNFELSGLSAQNNYIIGDGTYFKSIMQTVDEPDPDIAISGTASSGITHSMILEVDQTNSSFTQSFSTNF